eukprot:TRINITY_DN15734_c0_g1_i1.p1 TRINITY_DN15734_c0_g1~~TRINITY_DN15734_c0_g1_i1.p1  ORF type:complete len:678 (+),score=100.81 TRINITY_DN15734_c0_g1_i1:86-2035(+)
MAVSTSVMRLQEQISKLVDFHAKEYEDVVGEYESRVARLTQEVEGLRALVEQVSPGKLLLDSVATLPLPPVERDNQRKDLAIKDSKDERKRSTTSSDHDHEYSLRSNWSAELSNIIDGNTSSIASSRMVDARISERVSLTKAAGFMWHPHLPNEWVINPNGAFRLTWDVCGAGLIFYDVIMIPFTAAFDPSAGWFTTTMNWIALLFWTLDMCQACFLGYYQKDIYIKEHSKIIRNYLKSWFILDMIVVGPEWLTIIFEGSGDAFGGFGRLFKSARAIRVLRLLRLVKLQRLINALYDRLESEYTFICVNLFKLLASVAVLTHVIACCWYYTGSWGMYYDMENWIETANVEARTLPYRYTTALHWSLTQFTPASMDVSARNVIERLFSIIVLFFAMVTFSSIIGSITGAMNSIRGIRADEMKQFWLIRRFLRQQCISQDLGVRIFKFLSHQTEKQSTLVQRSNLKRLDQLSEELSFELTHELQRPFLVMHPFFSHIEVSMTVLMRQLCGGVMKPQSYAEKEVVFIAGSEASDMFFVKSGRLTYQVIGGVETEPEAKEWIGEPVLWTVWRHRGDFQATGPSDLIRLNTVKFSEKMAMHPKPWMYAKHYGQEFVKFLNAMPKDEVADVLNGENFYSRAVHYAAKPDARQVTT